MSLSAKFGFRLQNDSVLVIAEDGDVYETTGTEAAVLRELMTGASCTGSPDKVVAQLVQAGLIETVSDPPSVRLLCEDAVLERTLGELLSQAGVALGGAADLLTVVVTNDYLGIQPQWTHWLPVRPYGSQVWIGPMMRPESPVCWECVAFWLRIKRWRLALHLPPGESLLAPAHGLAGGNVTLAASMIAAALLHSPQRLHSSIVCADVRTLVMEESPLIGRINCPSCGANARSRKMPQRFEAWQSPLTGILERLTVASSPDGSNHLALSFSSPPLAVPGKVEPHQAQSVGGRGRNAEEARRSCLLEGIERHSVTYSGCEEVQERNPDVPCYSPAELSLYSQRQYHRARSGAPESCSEQQVRNWVLARSSTDGSTVQIPAGCVYLGYPFPQEPAYCDTDTNGCAAGQSIPQACLHGLLELVERDALGIWWYNRVARPAVRWRDWGDSDLANIARLLDKAKRSFVLLDVTNDAGIPSVAAYSADSTGADIYYASAADVCPLQAARRAAGELLQFWYWGTKGRSPQARKAWLQKGSLQTHSYFVPTMEVAAGEPVGSDVQNGLQFVMGQLSRCGLEVYYVDLTRPEFELPVVRTFVPGLRHYKPAFGPGRLYDVPLKLNWMAAALREDELNPDVCVL